MIKNCLTLEITYNDTEIEELILPIIKELNPEDYCYLFYSFFKISVVGINKKKIEEKLDELKKDNKIKDYKFKDDEQEWDISKIIASASCKISDYLKTKLNPKEIDKLVEELVTLPEINALAYAPLHFIINQLKLIDKETEIRFKLLKHPDYGKGYKLVGTNNSTIVR